MLGDLFVACVSISIPVCESMSCIHAMFLLLMTPMLGMHIVIREVPFPLQVNQKWRRQTLKIVMDRRAGLANIEGVANINTALADLSARAIAAIGERLYELMETNR